MSDEWAQCDFGCFVSFGGNRITHTDCPIHRAARIEDEPQAHMMSGPGNVGGFGQPEGGKELTGPVQIYGERKHVSDAGYEAYTKDGFVVGSKKAVEEDARNYGYTILSVAEHDELLAAKAALAHMTDAMEAMELKLRGDIAERDAEIERLKKEVKGERLGDNGDMAARDCSRFLVRVDATSLDPRLGTQQPEGEPCAPMSGRLYRWGTL